MGSVGALEVLVILVVALIVLGPERLPEAARQLGRFVAEVRRIGAGFQAEVRDAMNVPVPQPSPLPGSTPEGADPRTSSQAVLRPPGPSPEIADQVPPPRRPDDEQ